MDQYYVVIAGAGPVGGQCARDLAARDYDICVFETESKAEFPRQSNKSTAGTFPPMPAAFGVPDAAVRSQQRGVPTGGVQADWMLHHHGGGPP